MVVKRKPNEIKPQHNICWTHYTQTNTNNVNKTLVLLQTTRGEDEPSYFMRKS